MVPDYKTTLNHPQLQLAHPNMVTWLPSYSLPKLLRCKLNCEDDNSKLFRSVALHIQILGMIELQIGVKETLPICLVKALLHRFFVTIMMSISNK